MADVSIRHLVVEYTSGGYVVRPINGLDVQAGDGELVLLLGASGCGKTTLLSALAGILQPTAGTITVDGTSVTGLSGTALTEYRRHQVGIVFQAFNLIPSLTAAENVAVPLLATGNGAARGRSNGHDSSSARSTWPTASTTDPAIFRAVSSNGWRSPAPSRSNHRSYSPTNRPPTSTTSRSKE